MLIAKLSITAPQTTLEPIHRTSVISASSLGSQPHRSTYYRIQLHFAKAPATGCFHWIGSTFPEHAVVLPLPPQTPRIRSRPALRLHPEIACTCGWNSWGGKKKKSVDCLSVQIDVVVTDLSEDKFMARQTVSDAELARLGQFQGRIERNASIRQQAFNHNLGRNVRVVKLLA
jgi:hypothetical protein